MEGTSINNYLRQHFWFIIPPKHCISLTFIVMQDMWNGFLSFNDLSRENVGLPTLTTDSLPYHVLTFIAQQDIGESLFTFFASLAYVPLFLLELQNRLF